MTEGAHSADGKNSVALRSKRRDLAELAVSYGLILIVCWTPRPWQRLLWLVAAADIVAITWLSFDGLKAMGLRTANFFGSLWVVGAALGMSAVAVVVAARLHTLHVPGSLILFVETYWAYALWAGVQQFLLQCFFLSRLLRLLPNATVAAAAAAAIFALAHLPYRNLYSLAAAHAILGITIAITVPGPVDHNMRVGLGYLRYGHTHRAMRSAQP